MRYFDLVTLVYRKIARIWRKPRGHQLCESAPLLLPPPPKQKQVPSGQKDGQKREQSGIFYFRRDILDRLDEYFFYIKKLKQFDSDAYHFYRQVGAPVLPSGFAAPTFAPASWKQGHRPAGAIVTFVDPPEQDESTSDSIPPRLVYIRKQSYAPEGVQPSKGTVYQVIVQFDSKAQQRRLPKSGILGACYVSVDKNCNVTLLKEKSTQTVNIPSKREPISFHRTVWKYPEWIYVTNGILKTGQSPSEYIEEWFWIVASMYEQNSLGLRISVSRYDLTAVFSIDLLRTPYFFSDRNIRVNKNGRRKKIFHIVRTHERTNRNGTKSIVPTHFRGERRFEWNGYDVTISMPGWHHADFTHFDGCATVIPDDTPVPDGMINDESFGSIVRDEMNKDRSDMWRDRRKKLGTH